MKIKNTVIAGTLLSTTLLLSGCLGDKKITCSEPDGLNVVTSLLSDHIERTIKEGDPSISISAIRSAINSIDLSIGQVRTSKEDPNSTKVFCEATLVVKYPVSTIEDANTALTAWGHADDDSVPARMQMHGFEPAKSAADAYETTITYNMQPTDDRKQIFAEVEYGDDIYYGIADVLTWSLSKNNILQQAAEAKRLEEEEQARAIEQEQAEAAARMTQIAADLVQAENAYKQAVKEINTTWEALAPEVRDNLRAEQKAINKQREANCRAQALTHDVSKDEQETIRLDCEVEALNERNRELQLLDL